jgi:hypothetical protein
MRGDDNRRKETREQSDDYVESHADMRKERRNTQKNKQFGGVIGLA